MEIQKILMFSVLFLIEIKSNSLYCNIYIKIFFETTWSELFISFKEALADDYEYSLIQNLTRGYNQLARPSKNHTETTKVKFGLSLSQIMDVVSYKIR